MQMTGSWMAVPKATPLAVGAMIAKALSLFGWGLVPWLLVLIAFRIA